MPKGPKGEKRSERDIKNARALFLRLVRGRRAALAMLGRLISLRVSGPLDTHDVRLGSIPDGAAPPELVGLVP
jgi:hypothetical protein